MKYTHPSQFIFESYTDAMRLRVHLLIAWGYERAKPLLDTEDEEEISDILYQNIQHLLMVQEESWMANFDIKNEDPISGGQRKGKSRREIDLIIEFTGRGRPQYVFEAKALNWRKRHQRIDNYVNSQGLGRFITGEYADYTARFPEVSMLGYVLSDSVSDWYTWLNSAIDERKDNLHLFQTQEDVTICAKIPFEWVSIHKRESSDLPVTIYHILFDCQSQE